MEPGEKSQQEKASREGLKEMNLFYPDKRGLCFMQKNKGGVLHQKERGFALLSGLLLIRDVSINIPFSSTPVSSTAIHNSQSPSALHLSAQKVLIQARESCERLLRILKVLKCGIHFFLGLKIPIFVIKRLYIVLLTLHFQGHQV